MVTAAAAPPTIRAALCYGLTDPPIGKSHPSHVVIQPYHPAVLERRLSALLPQSRIYLYWNPTALPLDDDTLTSGRVRAVEIESRWGIARVDLREDASRNAVVARAVQMLNGPPGAVAGLFVDDLDRLEGLPGLAEHLLRQVVRGSGEVPRWFVNRAAYLWERLELLDAVLLENLTPDAVRGMGPRDLHWVRDSLLPAMGSLRKRGVPAVALDYSSGHKAREQAGSPESEALGELLADQLRSTDIHLTDWTGYQR